MQIGNVGAINDRPPKIKDFRISRREIIVVALQRQILLGQNLRAIIERPYD